MSDDRDVLVRWAASVTSISRRRAAESGRLPLSRVTVSIDLCSGELAVYVRHERWKTWWRGPASKFPHEALSEPHP